MKRERYIPDCDFRCGHCPAWDHCTAYEYTRDSWGNECTDEQEEERAAAMRDSGKAS